ncbi:MAG: pyridoxal-phosphate dependent enzyme [Acidobacteriota bacterium]|nr:pyridoxal-phosphate dependent enzyme [Acidobacteriota bacterium]
MWHENLLGTIGNTPLVKINKLTAHLPCTVLVKIEFFNPGGSVKDRIGLAMIEDAEKRGLLEPGGTIIEGTSGNTGAGIAIAAIAKGYRCIFTTTDKQSREKISVLRALGAEVLVCPTAVRPEDPRSYYSVAARLAKEIPNSIHVNQYENPANPQAHYVSTGPELWEQTEGRITHFIVGAGTGGTIVGTTKYLKEQNPDVQTIGVDPYGSVYYKYFHERVFDDNEIYPYLTEGVGEDILAGNMDFDIVDDYVRVDDKASMIMTRRLAREEGMFCGGSCGMVMAGAIDWMEANLDSLNEDSVVVVLLPDAGFRYLNKIYDDHWMKEHGFLETDTVATAATVLNGRAPRDLIYVAPDTTVAEAVELMTRHGISQVPVLDGDAVVGSVEETGILNLLVDNPDERQRLIQDVMSEPLTVLTPETTVEELSSYLGKPPGAVLVRADAPGGYRIITKSDLLGTLARK